MSFRDLNLKYTVTVMSHIESATESITFLISMHLKAKYTSCTNNERIHNAN